MSEARFTKGPWVAIKNQIGEWTVNCMSDYDDSSEDIGEFSSTVADMWNVTYGKCKNKNPKANAHLIACAPEMYEMLEMIADMPLDDAKHFLESDDAITKLLTKARGES